MCVNTLRVLCASVNTKVMSATETASLHTTNCLEEHGTDPSPLLEYQTGRVFVWAGDALTFPTDTKQRSCRKKKTKKTPHTTLKFVKMAAAVTFVMLCTNNNVNVY